jgi:hypothetical protein
MRDPRRRLERLEYENLRRMAAKAGQPHGYSADQVLGEARRFFALPDDQQRQVLQRLYNELSTKEAVELDAIRRRHAAILGRTR